MVGIVLVWLSVFAVQARDVCLSDSMGNVKQQDLGEVVVKADRPLVKVNENGGMVYDGKELAKNRPIATVYDLLDEVPGVIKKDDEIGILGTGMTTIIINGRRHLMSTRDITNYLTMMSSDRIERVEVYYDAPPQFGVKGGAINLVLKQKRSDKLSCNGSVWTSAYQGTKYYQVIGVGFHLYQKKWMLDTEFSFGNRKGIKQNNLSSLHTVDGVETNICNTSKRYLDSSAKKFIARYSYDFSKTERLEVSYVYRVDSNFYQSRSPLWVDAALESEASSGFGSFKHSHIVQTNYANKNWKVGLDFIYLADKSKQEMRDEEDENLFLNSLASQKVISGRFYANNMTKIGRGQLRYGLELSNTRTDNAYSNEWRIYDREMYGHLQDANEQNIQRERCYEVFSGWSQKFGNLSFSANLELSYFNAEIEKGNVVSTLWRKWMLLPNANINYKLAEAQSLVFSFSSNRVYPTYATTSGRKAYYNTYMYIANNPQLKPYSAYSMHLNYVVKSRYIVGLYATMEPNRFTQIFYQDPQVLEAGYETFNMACNHTYGLMSVVPHNWSSRIESKLTSYLAYRHTKGELKDISFDTTDLYGVFYLNNNVLLGKKKNWALQLNGVYNTPMMRGYLKEHALFRASMGMTWKPDKAGWNIVLKVNDLFDTDHLKYTVDYEGQHYQLVQYRDNRNAILTVRYSFNGYKQPKRKEVDVSRMGL